MPPPVLYVEKFLNKKAGCCPTRRPRSLKRNDCTIMLVFPALHILRYSHTSNFRHTQDKRDAALNAVPTAPRLPGLF